MLTLRSGTVVEASEPSTAMQELQVLTGGEIRLAMNDVSLHGLAEAGDSVVVNVAAIDLGLGSGGFDVVHVNLTRGLENGGDKGAHVMKLNYSSLQHAVNPVEEHVAPLKKGSTARGRLAEAPVSVCFLHGQLAPLAWAFFKEAPGARLGYVQTGGGALPGSLSKTVRHLRENLFLAGHITAGPTYGGEEEAISTAGALDYGFTAKSWDAAVCAPGPGILGSGTELGHGGMVALESTQTAAALGCQVVVAPRMSSGDPRPRHQGLSHHARTVLSLALTPCIVAVPTEFTDRPAALARHTWRSTEADLAGYAKSGLPTKTMGRTIEEDPLFFGAALAAGTTLAKIARAGR